LEEGCTDLVEVVKLGVVGGRAGVEGRDILPLKGMG